MGIPTYFKHIFFKYNDILNNIIEDEIDNFYMDLNCLIHPCSKNKNTDEEVINSVIKTMDIIINNINPKKKIYIAIDGVCPIAKVITQRKRRLKSIINNEDIKQIYEKHNKIQGSWDSINISPGTEFMKNLSNSITIYLDKIKNIKVIFNDSEHYEEGEQKIIKDIRKNELKEINCIYGLDSDLIILSLKEERKIYLYREKIEFISYYNVDYENFVFLNVDKLKEYLYIDLDEKKEFIKENIITDYIFLSFFIGNDFIPQLPSIKIRNNGITILIDEYKKLLLKHKNYLIIDIKKCIINKYFLYNLIKNISENEYSLLKNIHRNYYNNNNIKKSEHEDLFENDIKNNEIIDKTNLNNILKFDKIGYKKRYYKYYFNINKDENLEKYFEEINKICMNYIESLKWTLLYYTNNNIPSYIWYYKYNVSPFLIDIYYFIKYNNDIFNKIKFKIGKKINSLEQLSLIVPKEKNDLIPIENRNIINNISNYYDYRIDYHYKLFKHEGLVLLKNTNLLIY
jgi:5'-3' exoribonuclease 2